MAGESSSRVSDSEKVRERESPPIGYCTPIGYWLLVPGLGSLCGIRECPSIKRLSLNTNYSAITYQEIRLALTNGYVWDRYLNNDSLTRSAKHNTKQRNSLHLFLL